MNINAILKKYYLGWELKNYLVAKQKRREAWIELFEWNEFSILGFFGSFWAQAKKDIKN